MQDKIRKLEVERDACLATWKFKPEAADPSLPEQSPPHAQREGWRRLSAWLSARLRPPRDLA